MLPLSSKYREAAWDLLFPPRCIGCGKPGGFLCHPCLNSLKRLSPPLCPTCAQPLQTAGLCQRCQSHSPEIDRIIAPFEFSGAIRLAVYALKYRHLRSLAPTLAELLAVFLKEDPPEIDAIIPLPLHAKRRQERGYNQSELLARELGNLTGIPVTDGGLMRTRFSSPQVDTVGVAARFQNVSGAFACPDKFLDGQRLLLIDDVTTTGATLNAAASALKKAGAGYVTGLTLAKEID